MRALNVEHSNQLVFADQRNSQFTLGTGNTGNVIGEFSDILNQDGLLDFGSTPHNTLANHDRAHRFFGITKSRSSNKVQAIIIKQAYNRILEAKHIAGDP